MTSTSKAVTPSRKAAVTTVMVSSKEEMVLSWRLQNYSAGVQIAAAKGNDTIIRKIFFFAGGGDFGQASSVRGNSRVPLVCTLEHGVLTGIVGGNCTNYLRTVNLTLSLEKPEDPEVNPGVANPPASKHQRELWTFFEAKVRRKDNVDVSLLGNKEPKKLATGDWGFQYFRLCDLDKYLDESGSLNFTLEVTTCTAFGEDAIGDDGSTKSIREISTVQSEETFSSVSIQG